MKLQKILAVAGMSLLLDAAFGTVMHGYPQGQRIAQAAEATGGETSPAAVVMSHKSGVYGEAFTLTFSSEGAEKIYYTLDGSNPITSSTRKLYEGGVAIADRSGDENYVSAVDPILFDSANVKWNTGTKQYSTDKTAPAAEKVDKGTVVKAVAVDGQDNYGTVETNTYFVGTVAQHIQGAKESADAAGIPLSVMSISVDYADLFDYEKGIYVKGKVFDDALQAYLSENSKSSAATMEDMARRLSANYSQKGKSWERSAHIDYFETDGSTLKCRLQQDCGIRIQGNYSRSDLMKSFRLYAKADYGKKNFSYPFFENAKNDADETITKYKKLVLRNGGNYAFSGTKYNDTYWQSMLADLHCETQASRACVVYVDGEYWGLYILQQDYDDNYFEITHGVNKDTVAVYKASDAEEDSKYGYKLDEGTLPEGVTETEYYYRDLLNFFSTHSSLQREEDYQEFIKLVDPQSVMDYFAVNVWINNKWDWPGKNWSMWKATVTDPANEYADGRWRFCYYDMDFGGCGGSGEIYANTIRDDNYNTSIDSNGKYYNGKGLLGQNLAGPVNPALQCFILLMSNKSFREDYKTELSGLADSVFAEEIAVAKLDMFRGTYNPLFPQFYNRYNWNNDYENGYASYNRLKEFVKGREKGIGAIIQFIDNFFKDNGSNTTSSPSPTPETSVSPSPTPGASMSPSPAPDVPASPSPDPGGSSDSGSGNDGNDKADTNPADKKEVKMLAVTAKRNKKVIQVKTVAKAKVTVTLSQKIIVKGGKKVKKITVTSSGKGIARIKLSQKLTKGVKVTVTVKKNGYKTAKKTVKVG